MADLDLDEMEGLAREAQRSTSGEVRALASDVSALVGEVKRLARTLHALVEERTSRVPISHSQHLPRPLHPFPHPKDVSRRLAERAYSTYAGMFGGDSAQPLDQLIRRGSFSWPEFACFLQGHHPSTEHKICHRLALEACEREDGAERDREEMYRDLWKALGHPECGVRKWQAVLDEIEGLRRVALRVQG